MTSRIDQSRFGPDAYESKPFDPMAPPRERMSIGPALRTMADADREAALVKALETIVRSDRRQSYRTIEVDPAGNTMEAVEIDGPCAVIARTALAAYRRKV